MANDGTSSGEFVLGDAEVERPIETESRYRRAGKLIARRWKNWAVILVTGLTALGLLNIDGEWSKDVLTFVFLTVVLAGYTLFTLYSDLKVE